MRRLLLVGPPGAGKSSQGTALAERLRVPYLSTGELLRDEVRRLSPVGRRATGYMSAGRLVPDWMVLAVLEHHSSNAFESGFVLDGYPRTREQAERFMKSLGRTPIDRVVELATSDKIAVARLAARASCDRCGHSAPEVSASQCPRCRGVMRRRSDDDDPVARSRLETYRRQTGPMLEYFRHSALLTTIDGDRPTAVVTSDLCRLVGCREVHPA